MDQGEKAVRACLGDWFIQAAVWISGNVRGLLNPCSECIMIMMLERGSGMYVGKFYKVNIKVTEQSRGLLAQACLVLLRGKR